jgi:hypothetical protein
VPVAADTCGTVAERARGGLRARRSPPAVTDPMCGA